MSVLVLLVGMNPLPNWVVFKSLIAPGVPKHLVPDSVLLVHSSNPADKNSADVAENLRKQVDASGVTARKVALNDPRDGKAVRSTVLAAVRREAKDTEVHLNYTGGTKEMAVSAYAAVTKAAQDRQIRSATTSYLDVSQHRLRFDDGSFWPPARDLRSWVSISLRELLALHDRELLTREEMTGAAPKWQHSANAIWRLNYEAGGIAPVYRNWVHSQFARDGQAISIADLPDHGGFTLPAGEPLSSLATALRQDLKISDASDQITWQDLYTAFGAANKRGRKAVQDDVRKFFPGGWLEYWLRGQLATRVARHADWPLRHSVYARNVAGGTPCELDLVLLCGYQLFIFSCTTDPKLAKQKAFEVIHRAQQFGGEEARPLVAVPLDGDGVAKLQQDVESDFGGAGNLQIWGLDQLRDLDRAWAELLDRERLA
ncbi:MAG: hypothetical protein ACR2JY_00300 [Chloroflexota bacterium]